MAAVCVVVGEQFVCGGGEEAVELTVSKKAVSLSGGSFEVTDSKNGEVVFKMDGHAFSLRDKRVLLDACANPILSAHKKIISMHDKWEVCRGESYDEQAKLFSVKKASVIQFKTHLEVFLATNSNDDCPDFVVKGNFFEREAQIYQGDTLIAEVKRKFTVGNVLLDKHTFCTTILPGVDQAFIVTLIVIMDAIHED